MRHRSNVVYTRFSDEEYEKLQQNIASSGLTINAYIIDSALRYQILEPAIIEELQAQSDLLRAAYMQLKGIATNINQIAKKTNITGYTEDVNTLQECLAQAERQKQEISDIWQSAKQLITHRRV